MDPIQIWAAVGIVKEGRDTLIYEYKEIIVAVIAVVGVIFGAVCPYLFQRNKEINLKIAEQKRDAYSTFLTNFTGVAVAVMHEQDLSGMEVDRARMLARDKLLLYASDDVIRSYDEWIQYTDADNHDLSKEGDLISQFFLAVRRDILGRTKVTREQIDNLNPFNRG